MHLANWGRGYEKIRVSRRICIIVLDWLIQLRIKILCLVVSLYRSRVSVANGNRRQPAAISGGNRNARPVVYLLSIEINTRLLGRIT